MGLGDSVEVRGSRVDGRVRCPPSKSYTHRAVVIASLVDDGKPSVVRNALLARDTRATIHGCRVLGSYIESVEGEGDEGKDGGGYTGRMLIVHGRRGFTLGYREIDAENSGTTIRMLTAVSALVKEGNTMLYGDSSLNRRPMQPLLDALRQLGVECRSLASGTPPLLVNGCGIEGGDARITGSISSQFISALLIPSVYARRDVSVRVLGEQVSRPYIDSTLAVMRVFSAEVENDDYRYYSIPRQQYRHAYFTVPGDFSSAAIMLAAGALAGRVTVEGLDFTLPQADSRIVDILREMGASIHVDAGRGTVHVEESRLDGGSFNLGESPDLLPVVAVLALKCKGRVEITGVAHARFKETDRIANLARELSKLGAVVKELDDGLIITPPETVRDAMLESYDDHRLFMVLCIASLLTERSVVRGLSSVDVSYPSFLDDLMALGAGVRVLDQ
ncbi:MAG: 3-phosphoshikimate 1-carboxyvinyltransferase [Candidatus Nitrosocaldus sp.]|nr:3-phosphoshikimate 1-carboxyvinyltransferase [Candidatus Nitrosocaldus sp.]MDW7999582.1 3-phosphoshikimate 1-carboxyvinyltransferase [Candidatus Nitrosocaldus sp.]